MSWLLTLGVIAVFIWLLKTFWPNIRQRYFAAFLNYYTSETTPELDKMKKDLFSPMGSLVSHDPELRKNNAIKILEIGVGTGLNFAYYPENSRLVVVDPNPHFASYYNKNRAKFPNIQSEEIIVSTAEEMDMVPDNSVDAVVSTLVLCSVSNTEKILQQILRVLTPGGKYIFFDHIREFDTERHGMRRKIQGFLTGTGIWPFLFDGCYLTRDMLEIIQKAGFSKVQAQRFYNPINHILFQLITPSLKGVAEK